MEDKTGKFNLGDNPEGYRRNTDYDLDLFAVHEKKPARDENTKPQQKTQGGQRLRNTNKSNFFTKKPAQPVPDKKGPSVKRHAKPPVVKERKPAERKPVQQRPVRQRSMNEMRPEEKGLSQSERNMLHSQRRKAQQQRKQIIQYALIGVAVVAVMVVLSLTVFFKIDEIVIAGEASPYTDEQIIQQSGIRFDENIIMCDADGVSEKLAKALPYIGSAEVKRSLNGKVTITVKLTPGCFSFIEGDVAVIVDKSGKVLENEAPLGTAIKYAVVQGVTLTSATPGDKVEVSDKSKFELITNLMNQFEKVGIKSVTSIDVTSVYDISAVYEGRLTLRLGDTGSLERKLALGAKVIERENQIDPMQYGDIDLGSVEGKAFFRPLDAPENEGVYEDVPPEEESSTAEEESSTAEG